MLLVFSVLIILAVGYAQYRNGLSSSIAMLVSVVLAGLVAFNYWEPAADAVEPILQGSALAGCEDLIVLVGIFSVALCLLRVVIFTYIAPDMIEQHGYVQLFGAGGVGFVTGYLVAGFLVCAMETLPLDERFLDFEPRGPTEMPWRRMLPPDRVWLALMHHAGSYPLNSEIVDPDAPVADRFKTFDRHGTFELRYLRYRRNNAGKEPRPYLGEFERELKEKP
jgi:hypothetical protein